MKRKFEREERHKIVVDMNDFLLIYAMQVLGHGTENVAGKVYEAGKDDIKGIDSLLGDNGVGRLSKFQDIAEGSAKNLYDCSQEEAAKHGEELAVEAVKYLGQHTDEFNHWLAN